MCVCVGIQWLLFLITVINLHIFLSPHILTTEHSMAYIIFSFDLQALFVQFFHKKLNTYTQGFPHSIRGNEKLIVQFDLVD